MNIKTLITLIVCSVTSFVVAMDHPQPNIMSPRKNAVFAASTQLVVAQADAMNQSASEPTQNPPMIDQQLEKRVQDYLNDCEEIKREFPKLFATGAIEELYPGLQQHKLNTRLQIAMVRNNPGMVRACLFAMEKDPYFTAETLALLHDGIQQAEVVKDFCREHKSGAVINFDEDLVPLECIEKVLMYIEPIIDKANKEQHLLTGPCASRLPLTFLCESPANIEHTLKKMFKKELVVGLCQILLPAHREKAKSLNDAQAEKQYLEDLSKINSMVWEAYEKKPNKLEELKRLYDDLDALHSYYSSINAVNVQ